MSGYVYLIGSPLFGWYKIGKSKTPEIRVNHLGILLPFKIHIIGVWSAKNHSLLETTLHEKYRDQAINGEWFEFTKRGVYDVFNSLPVEARVYPIENTVHPLDRFSNIVEDTKDTSKGIRKILGLKVQKLRGNFTSAEREEKRFASMAERKAKKEHKNSLHNPD